MFTYSLYSLDFGLTAIC